MVEKNLVGTLEVKSKKNQYFSKASKKTQISTFDITKKNITIFSPNDIILAF